MNSRTSRPRSPISAMTLTSALRLARDHAQQRALADARAGEDADALAACPSVSSPSIARTPVSSGSLDRLALQRVGRLGRERHALRVLERPLAVDRVAEPVEDAAQQRRPHVHPEGAAQRRARCCRGADRPARRAASAARRARGTRRPPPGSSARRSDWSRGRARRALPPAPPPRSPAPPPAPPGRSARSAARPRCGRSTNPPPRSAARASAARPSPGWRSVWALQGSRRVWRVDESRRPRRTVGATRQYRCAFPRTKCGMMNGEQ